VYCIGFKKQFRMIRDEVFLVIYRGIDSFEGEPWRSGKAVGL
jgi:hypothetical protein